MSVIACLYTDMFCDNGFCCEGENQKEIKPALNKLRAHGIGGILDYAAEDDVKAEEGPASRSKLHDTVVARTFEYENEAKCEHHTGTFLKNIQAASDAPGQGFAAIKVSYGSLLRLCCLTLSGMALPASCVS